MGLDSREFFRLLPKATEGREYKVAGRQVTIEDHNGRVEITLSETTNRRVGPTLSMPVTFVELRFDGFSRSEARHFLKRFRRHYQRGGG